MVKINNPENSPSIYWEYGIFIVIAVVHGLINSISVKYNGFFNQTSLYWHLIGTLLLIIVALVLTPNKPDAKWVVKKAKGRKKALRSILGVGIFHPFPQIRPTIQTLLGWWRRRRLPQPHLLTPQHHSKPLPFVLISQEPLFLSCSQRSRPLARSYIKCNSFEGCTIIYRIIYEAYK